MYKPALAVFMLVLLCGAASADTRARSRCSIGPSAYARADDEVALVGTTLADSVHAGPGDVRPSSAGGHWGRGDAREVYGQVVRIDAVGADAPPALQPQADKTGGPRFVILVPWDYDASCRPTYWNRSASWIDPGLEGFYTVKFREAAEWINGVPVADVFFADIEPYPHGPFYEAGYRGTDALRTRASLTTREYLSLHAALPYRSELSSSSTAARGRLEQWVAENPDLATRYPADQIIGMARRALDSWR